MNVESNGPRTIHYTMIVLVMLTLISGALAFISQREASEMRTLLVDREQELSKATADLRLKERAFEELTAAKDGLERELRTNNQRIEDLAKIVDQQQEEIEKLSKSRVDVADGLILRVDEAAKVVWINLGEADFLKVRMTFDVYEKESQEVGRRPQDIKGKIEVTRILGPRLSEARIINDDLLRPMAKNDLVHSPAWKPGQTERISVIGRIDLDGDGKSDAEEFAKILAISGAEINDQVDEQGNRIPEDARITAQTHFLVLGDIPDANKINDEGEKASAIKIQKHLIDMMKEARAHGVRIVRINDFLSYESGVSKQRFRSGQIRPFKLKAGTASSRGNEPH